jgi:hypothetical protein
LFSLSFSPNQRQDFHMTQTQSGLKFDDLINRLQNMNGPDPSLDKVLAQILAWKQSNPKLHSDQNADEERVHWLAPKNSSGVSQVPNYTESLEQAYVFARQIAPKDKGGFSWEDGRASAVVGQGEPIQAATPIAALLIAGLENLAGRLAELKTGQSNA